MIPYWLVQKRAQTCGRCQQQRGCDAKATLSAEVMACPLGMQKPAADEIAAKAWPEDAPRTSGCCDSMLHVAR